MQKKAQRFWCAASAMVVISLESMKSQKWKFCARWSTQQQIAYLPNIIVILI